MSDAPNQSSDQAPNQAAQAGRAASENMLNEVHVSPTDIHGIDRSRQWPSGNLFRRRLPTVIEATAHTRQGSSGGPIYNERGEVTGLVAAGPTA